MSQYLQPTQNQSCRQVPGTVFRIYIPAGATINLLNLVELTSPSGICFIVRLPFLAGECGSHHSYENMFETIRRAGGRVEPINC